MKPWVIFAILFLVIAIAGGAYWYFFMYQPSQTSNVTSPSPSVSAQFTVNSMATTATVSMTSPASAMYIVYNSTTYTAAGSGNITSTTPVSIAGLMPLTNYTIMIIDPISMRSLGAQTFTTMTQSPNAPSPSLVPSPSRAPGS